MNSLSGTRAARSGMQRPWDGARRLALTATALLCSACSPAALLNPFIPSDGYLSHTDQAYGDADRQVLDIYVPEAHHELSPVIVYFYGGSWKRGSRQTYRFIAEAFAPKGFVVAIPDYRLYPDVRFPTFVEDAASAIRWVREHAPRFGGDPDRIILMGHSAGAHIAALLAFDDRYLSNAGVPATSLSGMVGIAGPYAFDPLAYRTTRPIFSTVTDSDAARPISFVDGEDIPALLLHGADDTTVLPWNAEQLAARIRESGGQATVREYADTGHIGIILSLAAPFRGRDTVYDDTVKFLNAL